MDITDPATANQPPVPPGYNYLPKKPDKPRTPTPALANICFVTAMGLFLAWSYVSSSLNLSNFWQNSIAQLTLALTAIIFCVIGRYNFIETFSLRPLSFKIIAFCVLLGVAGQFMVRLPTALNMWLLDFLGTFPVNSLFPTPKDVVEKIGFFVLAGLMAPLCEEILNRGFVLAGYKRLSFWRAIFFVGLLFGLFHLYPFRFAYTFILGMVMAYVVLVTRSILGSIAAHFGFNLLGSLSSFLPDSVREEAQNAAQQTDRTDFSTVLLSIPVTLIGLGVFLILLRVISKDAAKKRGDLVLNYFGIVTGVRADQAGSSGAFYGPSAYYRYGENGLAYATPQQQAAAQQPLAATPPLGGLSSGLWAASFILIGIVYAYGALTEIIIRRDPTLLTKNQKKTTSIVSPQPTPAEVPYRLTTIQRGIPVLFDSEKE